MIFEQIEVKGLAHYSYVVGCERAKEIVVVDPKRDVDTYIAYAQRHELTITHVLETHIHADYASGARELAERSGAPLMLSAYSTGELYETKMDYHPLKDGDTITLGSVTIRALHTPGHTPEHLSFLVYDAHVSTSEPHLLLSGDFLFIGSVGRPDLLGAEATHRLAQALWQSVRHVVSRLPDSLRIYPGHGAGSFCGAGMRAQASSTLGAERHSNPFLRRDLTQAEFVEQILASSPPLPPYYLRMKSLNALGQPSLDATIPGTGALDVDEFGSLVERGASVIDARDQSAFGAGHIPNSFGIGASSQFATWAAWVVPYDRPILLVLPNEGIAEELCRFLVRVGLDDVRGYLKGGMPAWCAAGMPHRTLEQIEPTDLAKRLSLGEKIQVVDVRFDHEWHAGHIQSALHLMGGALQDNLETLRGLSSKIALVCGGGVRSTTAASILERAGFELIANISGGMNAWLKAGLNVEIKQKVA